MVDVHAKENRTLSVSVIIMILIFAAVSTTQLASITVLTGGDNTISNVYARYSNSQAQSLDDDCGVGDAVSINCASNGSLIQGDGSASSPIVT